MMLSGSVAEIGFDGVPGLAGSITTGVSLAPLTGDDEQRRIGAAVAVGDGVLDCLRRSLTSIEAVVGRAWRERVAAVGVERQHAAARNRERQCRG